MHVEVKGLPHLLARLHHIASGVHGPMLNSAAKEAGEYLKQSIPPYPPPPPGSKYVRTYGLQDSLFADVEPLFAGVVQATVGSDMPDSPWVISKERVGEVGPQARIHVGRWYTLQEVLRKGKDKVMEIYHNLLAGLMR